MMSRGLAAFLTGWTIAACVWAADEKPRLHAVPDLDKNVKTGPVVGSKIPVFEAVDQSGARQTFESLKGPKGLALLFVRSADW
jgi:hypothetical protein